MEIMHYWHILRRRWWLALLPPLIVLFFSLATYRPTAPLYNVGLRFTVGYPPTAAGAYLYDQYYPAWLASEYIAGGLRDWAVTGDFAAAIDNELNQHGTPLNRSVAGAIASDHQRSIVTLSITWDDPAQLQTIAQAARTVLETRNAQAFAQLGPAGATVRAVDTPVINPLPAGLRTQLEIPLRIAIGLGLGLTLALLAHYFDPYIRDPAALHTLGYTLLGEIPPPPTASRLT